MDTIIVLADRDIEVRGRSLREVYWNIESDRVKIYYSLRTVLEERPRVVEILGMRYLIGFRDGYLYYRIDNIADFDRYLSRIGQSRYAYIPLKRTGKWQTKTINSIKTGQGAYSLFLILSY